MAERTTLPMKAADTAPRRWDPFQMFEAFQDELDRVWRRPGLMWPTAFPPSFRSAGGPGMAWAPRMDAYEKDNNLIVKAELPGIHKEDVQVELDDGNLVIRGESRAESEVKEQNFYRMERSVGTFYRRLPLPFEVQPDQIQANMRDGVLEVRIPRPAGTKSSAKKIPVS